MDNLTEHNETLPQLDKKPALVVKTGEQTQITPKIQEISQSIKGEGVIAIMNIVNHIKSMKAVTGSPEPIFSRTAEQVLNNNRYDGCNEAGVAFSALLRAKGIPNL